MTDDNQAHIRRIATAMRKTKAKAENEGAVCNFDTLARAAYIEARAIGREQLNAIADQLSSPPPEDGT